MFVRRGSVRLVRISPVKLQTVLPAIAKPELVVPAGHVAVPPPVPPPPVPPPPPGAVPALVAPGEAMLEPLQAARPSASDKMLALSAVRSLILKIPIQNQMVLHASKRAPGSHKQTSPSQRSRRFNDA